MSYIQILRDAEDDILLAAVTLPRTDPAYEVVRVLLDVRGIDLPDSSEIWDVHVDESDPADVCIWVLDADGNDVRHVFTFDEINFFEPT
jgi:hypothetical protein